MKRDTDRQTEASRLEVEKRCRVRSKVRRIHFLFEAKRGETEAKYFFASVYKSRFFFSLFASRWNIEIRSENMRKERKKKLNTFLFFAQKPNGKIGREKLCYFFVLKQNRKMCSENETYWSKTKQKYVPFCALSLEVKIWSKIRRLRSGSRFT